MAEQNEAKTKTIGFLPIEKVQTLTGWLGALTHFGKVTMSWVAGAAAEAANQVSYGEGHRDTVSRTTVSGTTEETAVTRTRKVRWLSDRHDRARRWKRAQSETV
jgi:hypothetical protein